MLERGRGIGWMRVGMWRVVGGGFGQELRMSGMVAGVFQVGFGMSGRVGEVFQRASRVFQTAAGMCRMGFFIQQN